MKTLQNFRGKIHALFVQSAGGSGYGGGSGMGPSGGGYLQQSYGITSPNILSPEKKVRRIVDRVPCTCTWFVCDRPAVLGKISRCYQ